MKTQIDTQTILGLFSATGLPPIFKAVIAFFHPSIFTLTCGRAWTDSAPDCYADARAEALLFLFLALAAVSYGVWRFVIYLRNNPTPTNKITVTDTDGRATAIATTNAPGDTTAPTPATNGGSPPKKGS